MTDENNAPKDNTGANVEKEETIKTVQRYMKKNSVIVTHMPYERTGLLFDMQPLVAGKGQIKRKSNFDIAKYGGYSSQHSLLFCC